MKDKKKRSLLAIGCNGLIVIFVIISMSMSFSNFGLGCLVFYTEDSNIFGAIACAIYLPFLIKKQINKDYKIPDWVITLKYISVCCLMVTFLVVIFILAPMYGFRYDIMLFYGSVLFNHFLNPVIAFLSFILFESGKPISKRQWVIALIPTIIYAAIAVALNIGKIIIGPYPFLMVYQNPVWMSAIWAVVIFGMVLLIALAVRFIKNKCLKRAP